MPLYEYQCLECGLRFEKIRPHTKRQDKADCPTCGTSSDRTLPATVSSVVEGAVKGPGPQNTGYASLDAHIDRVIGKSAQQGWSFQERRTKEKEEVIREAGVRRELYREPDGTWRLMTSEEQAASHTVRRINSQAVSFFRKRRRLQSQS